MLQSRTAVKHFIAKNMETVVSSICVPLGTVTLRLGFLVWRIIGHQGLWGQMRLACGNYIDSPWPRASAPHCSHLFHITVCSSGEDPEVRKVTKAAHPHPLLNMTPAQKQHKVSGRRRNHRKRAASPRKTSAFLPRNPLRAAPTL